MNVFIQLKKGKGSEVLVGFVEETDKTSGGSQAGHCCFLRSPEY